jgi:hypothetical protein
MKSAFLPHNHRIHFIFDVIKPGYAAARTALSKSQQSAQPQSA